MEHNFTCKLGNIQCIECIEKEQFYIEETERTLKDGVCEQHQKTNQPAGCHFNLPGHSKQDMKVKILERKKQ